MLATLPGIAYIEELIGDQLVLNYYIYDSVPELRINPEISPDVVCSVIGEIEAELEIEFNAKAYISDKTIRYTSDRLNIILSNPKCEWVVEKIEHHHHSSSSENVVGHMKCLA